jgi:hypothetical protein
MSTHEESWVVFQREVDDAAAMLRVDIGWAEEEHEGLDRPAIVEFSLPFAQVDPDTAGMAPVESELEGLADLEDQLAAAMDAAGGILVAVMSGLGSRRWVFYAGDGGAGETAAATLTHPRRSELELRVGDDPTWSLYHDFFLPDDDEMSVIANRGVFAALEQEGDIPERERPIEHLAYLPSQAAADQFATWARTSGFTVMSQFESEDAEEGMPSFGVEFSKVRPATPEAVMPDIEAATEEAERLDGFYDGWQTMPVTA